MSEQAKTVTYRDLTRPLAMSVVSSGPVAIRTAPQGQCQVRVSAVWPNFRPATKAAAETRARWDPTGPSSPNRDRDPAHRLSLTTPSAYPMLTELWLPPGSRFTVHTSRLAAVTAYGDFERSSIHNNHLGGCVRIPAVQGFVSATWSADDSGSASLRVVGRSCSIHVDGSRCPTSVNSDGSVRLDRIDADADVTTVTGPAYASEIDGNLAMQSSSGRLEAHLVSGNARLTTDTGSLHHSDIWGSLTTSRIADVDHEVAGQAITVAGLALSTPTTTHRGSSAHNTATGSQPRGAVGSPSSEQRLGRG